MEQELKVIKYIKTHPAWEEELSSPPYNLTIEKDGHLIMLKYSQIESDFYDPIVRECRGLIIDDEFNPVCVPFFKFGNYGEGYVPDIDWPSAVVQEKLDGSLIKLFWYDGDWRVATNGKINARNAEIQRTNLIDNFYQLFWVTVIEGGYTIPYTELNTDYTYMFELCTPYNRVVVPHTEMKLYHIGTRDNKTFQELDVDIGIPKPKTILLFTNFDEVVETAKNLPYNEEGYVVVDKHYNRVKVKSPAYVAAHHMISGFSPRQAVALIKANETEEFLTYFPEYEKDFKDIEKKIQNFVDYCGYFHRDVIGYNGKNMERKLFAQIVTTSVYPGFFFSWRDGYVQTPVEWLYRMDERKILEQLERLDEGY